MFIVYPVAIVLYYIVIGVLDITCPIKAITGKLCPTCGMTRATISLFHFDLEGYLYYNAMALPVIAALVIILCYKELKWHKAVLVIGIVILIINFLYYITRLRFGVII